MDLILPGITLPYSPHGRRLQAYKLNIMKDYIINKV
jgi:hypothetical protein